ncbi:MAG: glutathione S-transferase family protein [Burkholderiales bacterium]
MSYQLYYYPANASLAPHILLEEIGCEYTLVLVDRAANAHKSKAYLKLNPAGLIPALIDGDICLSETAAIMLHLADKHPAAALIPPLQSADRAQCYRWLIYLTNTLQADLIHYFYPDRLGGEFATEVKRRATARVTPMLDILDTQLAASGGPYLLGSTYTICDIFLFMMCRWTRDMPNPARNREHLGRFLDMMATRPAVIRAHQQEELDLPWY